MEALHEAIDKIFKPQYSVLSKHSYSAQPGKDSVTITTTYLDKNCKPIEVSRLKWVKGELPKNQQKFIENYKELNHLFVHAKPEILGQLQAEYQQKAQQYQQKADFLFAMGCISQEQPLPVLPQKSTKPGSLAHLM